ncbi:restriction endonuclease subunit S [Brevundimonas aurantiaca]|jgi:type I restriction enzyme S subunit|uniref:restriction endonuclease subunit S n=1 Tax=Brevundimonas aurantiaca TaxID=74316 RepID=UPI00174AF8E1|nr:restriction endonuclease subunit S [Brevundimonas aurantiaca]
MSSEAPECWSVKPLGEIADLIMGQSPPSSVVTESGAGLPFIQGNAEFGARHPKPRFVASHAPKVVQTGDILISVRAPVGEVNIAEGPLCIGRGVGGIRAKNCDPDFLFYAVSGLSRIFARLSQGSTFDAINGKELRAIEIPLPPLDEQRRIATVLRSVDEAAAGNGAVLAKAAETFALLSDELLVANAQHTGEPIRLGDLIETLEAGVSVNSEGRSAASDEIGILKTSCVSAGYFEPTEHKTVLESERSRVRVPVSGDSIIISRMNTFELVGANAFVDADYADLYLPDRLWLLKTNSRVRVRWLAFYMKTAKFREQVISIATGTSGSMKNISKGRLNDLIVYVPDDQRQTEDIDALSAVEAALLAARKIKASQQIAAAALKSDLLSGRVRVPA